MLTRMYAGCCGAEESKESGEPGGRDEDEEDEGAANDPEVIPQKLLTKYITYARANVRPQIHDIDQSKIEHFYQDLRRESTQCGGVRAAEQQAHASRAVANAETSV